MFQSPGFFRSTLKLSARPSQLMIVGRNVLFRWFLEVYLVFSRTDHVFGSVKSNFRFPLVFFSPAIFSDFSSPRCIRVLEVSTNRLYRFPLLWCVGRAQSARILSFFAMTILSVDFIFRCDSRKLKSVSVVMKRSVLSNRRNNSCYPWLYQLVRFSVFYRDVTLLGWLSDGCVWYTASLSRLDICFWRNW